MKEMIRLFFTFLKIGSFTFGGGYAMLPILHREIVEKRAWASEEDLAKYYAIGQTTPGIIAVNTATFIGYHKFGLLGAVLATLGLILPGIIIIFLIAGVMTGFSQVPEISSAVKGIKVAVTVLILEALLRLRKKSIMDRQNLLIFCLVLITAFLFPEISPVYLVLSAGLLGFVLTKYKGGRQ